MKRRRFIGLAGSVMAGTVIGDDTPLSAISPGTDLDDHRVYDVRFTHVELRWPRHVGRNAWSDVLGYVPGNGRRGRRIAVIRTDKGAVGWGINTVWGAKSRKLADKMKGEQLSEIIDPAAGVVAPEYVGFEFALFDLAGKVMKKPVYQLLGRQEPIICPVYSGMIYFDDLDAPNKAAGFEKIVAECQFDYDYGYRQFKIKIGRGYKWMPKEEGMKRDIEITKLVNDKFPDCDILVDANNGYTLEDFYRYLDGVSDVELFWIEEPFDEAVGRYRQLNSWIKENHRNVLLADGEYRPDHDQMMKLAAEGLVDVFVQDIAGYGFTNWVKLMPKLKPMGILASPHNWGILLKTYYTSHLAGALGNTVTIEGVTCASKDIDFGEYKIIDGKLIPSPRPGFGMDLLKKV